MSNITKQALEASLKRLLLQKPLDQNHDCRTSPRTAGSAA